MQSDNSPSPQAARPANHAPKYRRLVAGLNGSDPNFLRRLFTLGLPIMLQQLVSASLNMVGVLMIGQLGETAVASVGLANQFVFVFTFLLFGMASGVAIFAAQFWGRRDVAGIRKVLGLGLIVSLLGGVIFLVAAVFLPGHVLRFYSADPAVHELGSLYLRILAPGFLFSALTYPYSAALRSTGDTRTPLFVSVVALLVNLILSYSLIFGLGPLPTLGVGGAAIGTVTARMLECGLLLSLVYRRRTPVAARLRELLAFDWAFAQQVLSRSLPVAINETLWSLGVTTYYAIYAHVGTNAAAAVAIAATIDALAFVVFVGICDACGILIGHRIGAGEEDKAFGYAARSLAICMVGALGMGLLILLASAGILSLYKVAPDVAAGARNVLAVIAATLWVRVGNMTLIVGILRAGGDTRYPAIVDLCCVYFIGMPLAYLGAFVLRLPIHWVYLLVMMEEFAKLGIVMARFLSRRWIHNVVHAL